MDSDLTFQFSDKAPQQVQTIKPLNISSYLYSTPSKKLNDFSTKKNENVDLRTEILNWYSF